MVEDKENFYLKYRVIAGLPVRQLCLSTLSSLKIRILLVVLDKTNKNLPMDERMDIKVKGYDTLKGV